MAATVPAFAIDAECAAQLQSDPPIRDTLPISPNASDQVLARFALPYALMISDAERPFRDSLGPYGFTRGVDSKEVFLGLGEGDRLKSAVTGFYATTYLHCSGDALVIVFRSVSAYDLRDYVTALDRQLGDGVSSLALSFIDAIRARYPDHHFAVAGHSAAGGVASFVGAARSVPSVVFDATRNDAALTNDGRNQLVVYVAGDVLSDPDATATPSLVGLVEPLTDRDQALRGITLRIEPIAEPLFPLQLHWSGFLIRELEALAFEGG